MLSWKPQVHSFRNAINHGFYTQNGPRLHDKIIQSVLHVSVFIFLPMCQSEALTHLSALCVDTYCQPGIRSLLYSSLYFDPKCAGSSLSRFQRHRSWPSSPPSGAQLLEPTSLGLATSTLGGRGGFRKASQLVYILGLKPPSFRKLGQPPSQPLTKQILSGHRCQSFPKPSTILPCFSPGLIKSSKHGSSLLGSRAYRSYFHRGAEQTVHPQNVHLLVRTWLERLRLI